MPENGNGPGARNETRGCVRKCARTGSVCSPNALFQARGALFGESLGGAQMSGRRQAIVIRSTLEEKGVS